MNENLSVFLIFASLQGLFGSLPVEESSLYVNKSSKRFFVIDYKNNVFLKDDKPFRYVSGSLHYFRVPREYWRDRLRKYRAAGLNAISTYVEWSTHEPSPGKYEFTGEKDIEHFLQLAVEEDLLVILRPGPYICAERDFGGLPPWLLTLYPRIQLRTNDKDYQKEVEKWFNVLFPRLKKHLYSNGGPIIMVQVENEYGLYNACNTEHKIWLREQVKFHVGNTTVLFTTDPSKTESVLRCGTIPNVYATVDFGTAVNATTAFTMMRKFAPHGPLVNSEFYPGWLSHWEEPLQRVDTSKVLNTMKNMLDLNASFNFYMFHGGTNFGFMNGANYDNDEYKPQLTSYDYDAPLDEAGDPTPKYFAIRDLLSKYYPLPKIPPPQPAPKGKYGVVTLKPLFSLFNYSHIPDSIIETSTNPKTFEEMNVKYGYVLYQTTIPSDIADPSILCVLGLRDRATVYVDKICAGVLSRKRRIYSSSLLASPGKTLSLLVENQGRINFGTQLKDKKGLIEVPLLNGQPLHPWIMIGFPFENTSWMLNVSPSPVIVEPPAFYGGEFTLPTKGSPLDTFVDLTGWGKGVIFINSFNLGRYWPSAGSQVTLYIPGIYLHPRPQKNIVTIFETEYVPINHQIILTNTPNLNKKPSPSQQVTLKSCI